MYHRIRDLREDINLNQTAAALTLNMSQTGYSKYETGENDIPTAVLQKPAVYCGTSVDYILELTDQKTPFPYNEQAKRQNSRPKVSFLTILYMI